MMKIRSFRTRVIVIIIPLIVLVCMSYLLFFLNRMNDRLERELMTRGSSLARNLASSSELALLSEDITFLESSLTGISEEEDVVYVIIYNQGGQVIAFNKKVELNEELTDEVIQRVRSEKVPLQRKNYAKNGELFYDFLAPVTVTSGFAGWGSLGEQIGVVRIALSLDRIKSERTRILLIGMIAVFLFVGLGIVAAVVLARRMSRPLDRLMEGIIAISSGDLEHRLDIATSDEIGKLASTFNQMTDDLKKSKQEIEVYSKNLERRVEERTKELDEKVSELGKSITERKHAEEALRESEKRFKQLAENAEEWIWEVDADGLYTYSSPVVEKVLGFKSKEIIGKKHFFDLFAPDVREDLKKGAFETFARKESFKNFVNPNVHKNGSLVILETSGIPIIDDKGNFLGYRGVDTDITERQRMLETTKKSEERFRDLFENANDAIWTADLKGKYMTVNNLFGKLLDFKKEELIGKKSIYLVAPESRKESIENYKKALTGESAEYELVVLNKKGERRIHRERLRPIKEGGKIIGVQGIGRNITEQKRNEQLQKVVYNISKAANSPITLNQLYKTIHQELSTIIDTTNFYIALVDEKENKVFFPYHQDEKDDNFSVLKLSSNTPTTYVIKTGQSFLINKKQLEEMLAQGALTPWGTVTDKSVWLGVPLKGEDKTIGAMALQSYTNPELYSKKDIKILEFISFQIATAIQRKHTEEKLKFLSFHDALTGLYNRAYFEEELKRLNNSRYYPLNIISLDVNGLKVVNDTFGHDQGDKLLQHLASLLTSISRKGDIIARVGGDEFAILLPSTSSQATLDFCERIRKVCLEDDIKPAYLRVNLALGHVTQEGEYKDIKTFLKEADQNMYQDKLFSAKSREKHLLDSFQLILAERDPHTEDHARRLQELALALGKRVGLTEYQLNNLRLLALLHDIGKIGIPDSILFKTSSLTPSEWKKMKEHSRIGYRMAKQIPDFAPIAQEILYHHEHWDGSGYPEGLKGEKIPILSRIISIVDAYDVMQSRRPYKRKITKVKALKEIKRYAGTQFDPQLVEIFLKIVKT